ncbi:MAG: hypothetical protein QW555_06795 [Nitrososphaerota archaeon]
MRGRALLLSLLILLAIQALPPTASPNNNSPLTYDELLLQLSDRIPGFAGFFVDENGRLTLSLTGNISAQAFGQFATMASTFSQVRADVAEALSTGRYRLVSANFDFRTLWTWRASILSERRITSALSFIDIEERGNRLLIGVSTSANASEVARLVSELGIPEAGFNIVTAQIKPLATLRDHVRPTVGGLQIAFSSYLCTLGFNVLRSGTRGYLVNSHCTTSQWQPDGTAHYQPYATSSSYAIGVEQVDPPYFTSPPCPSGYQCRYSDAAFGRYLSSVSSSLGKIARTSGIGSITLVGEWTIIGEVGYPLAGETLNKVGRTTGWSQGPVAYTCATTFVSGTNYVLPCQDIVRANVGAGDSGSPVFKVVDSSAGTVQLYGILWGGGDINGVRHFVFSNMANIERELGDLVTFQTSQVTPRINVLYPNGGETLVIDSTIQIQWASQAVSGNVRILLSRDGGSTWTTLFSDTANDGSEQWRVTSPPTNTALIRVESINNPAVYDTSNSTFRIVEPTGQQITVRVIRPNGGETLRANSYYLIYWSVSGGAEIIRTQIYFSSNGGASWSLIATLSGNPRYYAWRVPSIATNSGLIKVVVTDSLGQVGEDRSDRTFRITL